jgi:hypothetical protein
VRTPDFLYSIGSSLRPSDKSLGRAFAAQQLCKNSSHTTNTQSPRRSRAAGSGGRAGSNGSWLLGGLRDSPVSLEHEHVAGAFPSANAIRRLVGERRTDFEGDAREDQLLAAGRRDGLSDFWIVERVD